MAVSLELLEKFAHKYVWWKAPDEAVMRPDKIAAQIMNLGDYDDVQRLVREVGEPYLRGVLMHAEAGQFNPQSWTYWHYRLGLSSPGEVPPLPRRKVA